MTPLTFPAAERPVDPASAQADTGPQSGERTRVLVMATAGFTVFFAVWVMFAIIGIPLRKDLGLTDSQFALLAAIPILTGSILRVPFGLFTDRIGGRRVFTALLLFAAVPTFLVSRADTYHQLLVLAFFTGFAGISFAVGIAWVSAWFPSELQGFALGTFGAGNVGASITKLLAPALVTLVAAGGAAGGVIPGGWRLVPFVFSIGLVVTAVAVTLIAPRHDRRPARGRTLADLSRPLRVLRVWRFGLYYVVVFGAYVGLSLWLPKYYVDVYGVGLARAVLLTSLFIFPASLLRPLGGLLSDRIGARPVTYGAFIVLCAALLTLSFPAGITRFTVLVIVVGVTMGIGKASVYKHIADYFPRDVGAVGGLVGAIGGLGGFVLPLMFAWAQSLGDEKRPENTFVVLFAATVTSLLWLALVVLRMRRHERMGPA